MLANFEIWIYINKGYIKQDIEYIMYKIKRKIIVYLIYVKINKTKMILIYKDSVI